MKRLPLILAALALCAVLGMSLSVFAASPHAGEKCDWKGRLTAEPGGWTTGTPIIENGIFSSRYLCEEWLDSLHVPSGYEVTSEYCFNTCGPVEQDN